MYAITIILFFLLFFQTFSPLSVSATIGIPDKEGICTQQQEKTQNCEELPKNQLLVPQKKTIITEKNNNTKSPPSYTVIIYFFEGKGCPFCEKEKLFLKEMQKTFKNLQIKEYEVWHNKDNAFLLQQMMNFFNLPLQGVPVTFIGDKVFIGFSEDMKKEIKKAIERCLTSPCVNTIELIEKKTKAEYLQKPSETIKLDQSFKEQIKLPLIGNVDLANLSLPLLTLFIAGLDSFNPCAFFVLFALLGLLVHAGSRKRIFLIGIIFVFFSGFIYFVFMAAWLNLFVFMGNVSGITTTAGVISLLIALINIKDFFIFKKGISLTIPESAKPGLFDKMRKLMRSTSTLSILLGTVVLAITANSYELLCTAGFPLVYTRILTLHDLPQSIYYFYLAFYNIVYVIPLLLIVVVCTVTLGKKKLSEKQGRILKLLSGIMMLELAILLLFKPELLNNALIAVGLLTVAIFFTALMSFFIKQTKHSISY
ncbi:MAG: hypothetical protein N3A59_01375 [Thermodesulfovibrionales bacterium]|nr:hypothetical protein [Thermodesulfovibrionales bacterium]